MSYRLPTLLCALWAALWVALGYDAVVLLNLNPYR